MSLPRRRGLDSVRARRSQGLRVGLTGGLAAIAFLGVTPGLTGASFVANGTVTSDPITAGQWNAYVSTVLTTSPAPTTYWRLNESTGAVAVDDSASGVAASPQGSLIWETAGLLTGETSTAVGFSGDPSSVPAVVAGTQTAAPDAFTLTAWVYLGAGGRLLGFGDAGSGLSTTADRVLYVDDAGLLCLGVRTGPLVVERSTICSDASVLGAPHHVAATLGATGMTLYVDGVAQAQTDGATTSGLAYSGWWRLGADTLDTSWPGLTTADDVVSGTVDEVAIWDSALDGTAIAALAAGNHT